MNDPYPSAPSAPRPALRARSARVYTPPGDTPAPGELRLDANEGRPALNPPPATTELLRRYARPAALEARIARGLGVEPARVVVTAGADDALDRLCRATLESGGTALLTDPTFEMLPRYVALAGADAIAIPWLDGPFPVDAFERGTDDRLRAIFAVTPNNPTGLGAGTPDLLRLADLARARGALLVADLAYVEFADEDPTPALLAHPNAVVARTFSKAWGLAGLRVGYAVGPAPVIDWLRAVGHPYPTSAFSLAAVADALDRAGDALRESVARVRSERDALASLLRARGVDVLPSQANFVLARFAPPLPSAFSIEPASLSPRRSSPAALSEPSRPTRNGLGIDFTRNAWTNGPRQSC